MDKKQETIVLIHGAEHGAWCWVNFERYFLNEGYRVITPDLRKERLELARKHLSHSEYVNIIHEIIIKLEIPPIIITHSLSGVVLELYLKRYGDAVKKVVFLAPLPPDNIYRTLFLTKCHMIFRRRDKLYFSGKLDKKTSDIYLSKLEKEPLKIQMGALKRVWYRNNKPQIDALVIGGWDDKCLPLFSAYRMGRYLKCKTIILDGLSHDMMLDREWEKVAKEISVFIEAL